ncbi:30S ribosomal protein S19 [Candidatus Methanoliparum sp. LAM-1]|uniref:30S ribosomal protein S19 n=1 Tax=Candidatus Methanoliparum sp. LAM-1 TaxID=2874846 RepID=UPI001E5D9D33|nr:30S ribosomal protein S19 [Candidatus Methanoliparum sp. LAM-1]BDC35381.1 30S ribosomal protein S19 [Candidatus Methanoliparum sp. LAM-1]
MAKKDRKVQRVEKIYSYRGYTLEELRKMDIITLSSILPSRIRRKINRGFRNSEKKLLKRMKEKNNVRTHLRDMIILPSMVGRTVKIHNGKEFISVEIQPDMIGHYLGEFALTRKEVKHGSAGLGATRSSKFIPLK